MMKIFKRYRVLVTIFAALIVAFLSAKLLVQGSAIVALPWGILAILCSTMASTKKETLWLGGYFGFVVAYAYLWFDNTGGLTGTKVFGLLVLLALPACFGLICGVLASWLGWSVRSRLAARGNR